MNGGGRKSMKECAEGVLMEAIRMVLVTLVLVTGGVLALALVAHLTARVQRRSTGPRFLGSLGDRPGDRSAGDGAGDGGSVGPPTALDTRGGFACPASSDDLEGVARMERWDGNVS
jgi:hypothetical protein